MRVFSGKGGVGGGGGRGVENIQDKKDKMFRQCKPHRQRVRHCECRAGRPAYGSDRGSRKEKRQEGRGSTVSSKGD